MQRNTINAFLLLILGLLGEFVFAQSLESIHAKIRSLEACKQSIDNSQCNLKILDKDLQESLVQLDRLNKMRQNRPTENTLDFPSNGRIQFSTTTISEANGEIVKMMGGSVWGLNRSFFGLPLQDVIIVMTDQKNAIIYVEDN
jgi:hypothetical protein